MSLKSFLLYDGMRCTLYCFRLILWVPVVNFELHGAVVVDGVGRLHIGLQVQFEVVERRERQARNDVVVELIDDRLDHGFIYAVEGPFHFFFGLGRESEAVPVFAMM